MFAICKCSMVLEKYNAGALQTFNSGILLTEEEVQFTPSVWCPLLPLPYWWLLALSLCFGHTTSLSDPQIYQDSVSPSYIFTAFFLRMELALILAELSLFFFFWYLNHSAVTIRWNSHIRPTLMTNISSLY